MAFSLLNAAKPLSLVKLHGSELYRLSIHCLKIVFPFISSKFIAFHSNCMSSVLVLLGSLYERIIYFCLSRGYFLPIFPIPCIHLLSVLHHLNLPISPHQKALLASNRFCYPLCFLLCHFAELWWTKPEDGTHPCVSHASVPESNRAALGWHSGRTGTGHYHRIFWAGTNPKFHKDHQVQLLSE